MKDALTGSQIFSLFEHIITTVLGVPSLPKDVKGDSLDLSLWSVDALMRARAKENAKDSVEVLASIVRLVEKIENMPVRKDVRDGVLAALEELETVSPPALHASQIETLLIWNFLVDVPCAFYLFFGSSRTFTKGSRALFESFLQSWYGRHALFPSRTQVCHLYALCSGKFAACSDVGAGDQGHSKGSKGDIRT